MKNYINKPDILKWYVYKILLIMRLTTVILMVSMLQVSASTVAQEFNYVKKGVSLIQIFKEIKKQTGYNIIWNEKKIDVTTTIDANFKKASIHDVLNKCLSDLPVSYSINDKMVMIKEAKPSFRKKLVDFFNFIDVRGRVVDENIQPLAGATVKVKGTKITTSTNVDGEFVLNNVNESAVLVISYLGYETQEITASGNIGTIKLNLNTDKLQEVEINAGYYTVKERERTGSISRVTAAQIADQPINNPLMSLVGLVSGVQVTQQSGVPGRDFTVQVRGRNSIARGSEPLYIVDGVNFTSASLSGGGTSNILGSDGASPLSMINPLDIESIEILKDADATSIYGSRGANGVILITTKKATEGLTKINTSVVKGISQVAHRTDLLNTEQYLQMRTEAYKNDGLKIGTIDYDVNGTYDQNRYTDWQEELIGRNSQTTGASITASAGTAKINYLIGGNLYKEGVVFPGDFGFNRVSLRSNINIGSSKDRLSATFTSNYSHSKSELPSTDLSSFILLAPNAPDPYDEFGKLTWSNNSVAVNPMSYLLSTSDSGSDSFVGNMTLSYSILKKLVFKTSFGYSTLRRNELQKNPLAAISPYSSNYVSTRRITYFTDINDQSVLAEPVITYETNFLGGTVNALLGASLQDNNYKRRTIKSSNFTSDDLMENIGSAALLETNVNSLSQYRYIAGFARLNYTLRNKYFLNLTTRRDGSSRFGADRQFANFGAIGAAWIFSDEKLFKEKLPFLSFGKVRASYGTTGNDQISDYGYLQVWNTGATYQGNPTIAPNFAAPNPDFSWEITRKMEAAIHLGFFNNKLNTEISFYRNRSSNQLLNKFLPLSTGLSAVVVNMPAEVQNTGWEFDTSFKILNSGKWKWTTGFNITLPKNKLLSYPGLETSNDAITYQIGHPLSILKVYNVSVDPQTGLYVTEDYNGNGSRDNGDRYLVKFLGQKYYGGIFNHLKYKGLNFDFLFSFTKQNGRSHLLPATQAPGVGLPTGALGNNFSQVLSRWQQPGDQTLTQKFSSTSTNNSLYGTVSRSGNISVVDASFIRLRNISLSYSLPKRILPSTKIGNAEISLQGQNIFTITEYIGLDPETQAFTVPPLRSISISLTVTF